MPARTRPTSSPHDSGQTTVLTIGMTAVVVALCLVLLAVTSVQVQARKVQSLADGAALAGAEELGFQLDQDPTVVLDQGAVDASVQGYLEAVGARDLVPGIGGAQAVVAADGTTVVVHVKAQVSLAPPRGVFASILPVTVPVEAEGSSRTALTR